VRLRSNKDQCARQQNALRNVSSRAVCWSSDPIWIAASALQSRDRFDLGRTFSYLLVPLAFPLP
jgi:hypothetical protein